MKRSDLYKAVWSDPVSHVARRIGMSDRGLIDVCRQAEIPTPPRGYWRKVHTGQTPDRPALKRPEDDSDVPVSLDRPSKPSESPPIASAAPAAVSVAADRPIPAETKPSSRDWLEPLPEETPGKAAVRAEYQKLANLADAFARHQQVTCFLDQLEAVECKESLRTATILRRWVAAIRKHQAEAGPVEIAMKEFRALSFSRQRPVWWDSV